MKQEEYRKTIEKAFPLRKELKQDMSRELFRTQNKKRGKKRYVISAVAAGVAAAAILCTMNLQQQADNGQQASSGNPVIDAVRNVAQKTFSLTVYASDEVDGTSEPVSIEPGKEYVLSSDNTNVYNKFYNIYPQHYMPNEDELSDSGMKVAGYGFNIRVEGEDISEITFINKNGFFLKKIDYYYREALPEYEEEMKEFFAQYPYGYGIALKESAYKDLTPENTGADDTIMWYFVDAGNRYTVAYDQQGTADNLYALGFTAPAEEPFVLDEDNNWVSTWLPYMDDFNNTVITVQVKYNDGSIEEKDIKLKTDDYWNMKIMVCE